MTSRRIALWAAGTAAVVWAAKATAIGIAGDVGESPLESPLFFAGLLAFIVAVVAVGIAVTAGQRTWIRVAAGVGAFVAGFALSLALDAVVGAFHEPGAERHWVWTEFNLWVSCLVVQALAVVMNRRGPHLASGGADRGRGADTNRPGLATG